MAIASVTNPVGTLTTGHTVTANEWNSVHDTLYNYLNNTVKVAIDALQAAPAPTIVAQGVFDAMLTFQSGTPLPSADQTAKTTVYLTPFKGNQIGLYDGAAWGLFSLTEISIAIPSVKLQNYDVFVYNSAGLVLEIVAWKTVSASNSPSAGSSVVISVSDTTGVAVGDAITVRDGSNAEVAVVTAVNPSTSITVDVLAASYTSPTIGYSSRATDITLQDGVYCKSGALTKRYCGSLRTTATAGQSEDSLARGFLYNENKPKVRLLASTTGVTSSGAQSLGPVNSNITDGAGRVSFLVGSRTAMVDARAACYTGIANASDVSNFGIGINSRSSISGDDVRDTIGGGNSNNIGLSGGLTASAEAYRGIGLHYLQLLGATTSSGQIINGKLHARVQI